MKRCRCCRQDWPEEFFTVCRPDGLRRSTCNACRKGCRPGSRVARNRAYRARIRSQIDAIRNARSGRIRTDGSGVSQSFILSRDASPRATTLTAGVVASDRSSGR